MSVTRRIVSWINRSAGRLFQSWETEIARPVLVAIATTVVLFLFSLLFSPVRRFLFDDTVPYPIYCTAETYSTSRDFTTARTELMLVNTTTRDLSRLDLEKDLSGAGGGVHPPSPDLRLVYLRDSGHVVTAEADTMFNDEKGEVNATHEANDVLVTVQHLNPRAMLRVNIDIAGLDGVEIKRAAHSIVPFKIEAYEQACYTR